MTGRLAVLCLLSTLRVLGQTPCRPSTPNASGQTPWTWKDSDGITKSRAQLEQILGDHEKWVNHKGGEQADFTGATLNGADFSGRTLSSADFTGAKLCGAIFDNAHLNDAYFAGGVDSLPGANLQNASFKGAFLTAADFTKADLSAADFSEASLVGTDFSYAIVKFATYEPTDGTYPWLISTARGLADLKFNDNPQPINDLRGSFRNGGFTDQERDLTRAIHRHEPRAPVERALGAHPRFDHPILYDVVELENQLPLLRYRFSQLSYLIQQVLFDWPCGWGADPGRPVVIIAVLALLCTPVYWIGMHLTLGRGGLFLVATGERIPTAGAKERVLRISVSPSSQSATSDPPAHNLGKKARILARRRARRIRLKREYKALRTAFLFSLMSVFNIGFDGFNGGLWIRMLQSREFDVRARGWMRTVSGVQSLLGVGLLALAVLSYFGHPFE